MGKHLMTLSISWKQAYSLTTEGPGNRLIVYYSGSWKQAYSLLAVGPGNRLIVYYSGPQQVYSLLQWSLTRAYKGPTTVVLNRRIVYYSDPQPFS
ncbi:hypothetical protein Btru_067051 [Bulinus truncatus]|nr:hypothetical protein Btru_067051 [Bulinus truncatus]